MVDVIPANFYETLNFYISTAEEGTCSVPKDKLVEVQNVLRALQAAQPGWRMVPEEPTREMWAAMADTLYGYKNRHHDKVVGDLWAAMLEAAPLPPPPAEGER
jgi:phytoene/squalene synthetase